MQKLNQGKQAFLEILACFFEATNNIKHLDCKIWILDFKERLLT